ncbi:hypothetical protein FOV72_20980 [Gordonia rubripertincta]|uniref:hypothetical protein n=1 Tax=Gordonia rubripertincta TaxID=36822 RepID=UPI00117BED2C|nr:hypothetical protein [Gordonia rubripertincta]TSD93121.1 hypothetical protein FOV72_20980 [Gordonia rubripertincta]
MVIIATIAGVLAAVLTAVGVYFAWSQHRRNQLQINVVPRPIISAHSPKRITVNYDGARLQDPHIVAITVVNRGPRDIRRDEFDAPIRLELGVPQINITDEAELDQLEIEQVNTHLDIKPTLFATGRSYHARLITSGRPTPRIMHDKVANADVALGRTQGAGSGYTRLRLSWQELVGLASVVALCSIGVVVVVSAFTVLPSGERDVLEPVTPTSTVTVTVTGQQTPPVPPGAAVPSAAPAAR